MQPWQERSESLRQSVSSAKKKKNIGIQALKKSQLVKRLFVRHQLNSQ
jgi:hypothetical protein